MGALGLGFESALRLETTLGYIYTCACISYWDIRYWFTKNKPQAIREN